MGNHDMAAILAILCLTLLNRGRCSQLVYYHVGIFSICQNTSISPTTRNSDAETYSNLLQDIIYEHTKDPRFHMVKNPEKLFTYVQYDICNDYRKLTSVAIEILLDAGYGLPGDDSNSKSINTSMVAFVYTHLTPHMSRHVYNILSFTDIPVHLFELEQRGDGTFFSPKLYYYTNHLLHLTETFQWNDLFLVSITENDDFFPYHIYYEHSIKKLVKRQKCLQLHHLDIKEANSRTYFNITWLKDHPKPTVILFGRDRFMTGTLWRIKELFDQTEIPILTHDVDINYMFKYLPGNLPFYPTTFYDTLDFDRKRYGDKDPYGSRKSLSAATNRKIKGLAKYMLYEFDNLFTALLHINTQIIFNSNRYATSSSQIHEFKRVRKSTKINLKIYSQPKQWTNVRQDNMNFYYSLYKKYTVNMKTDTSTKCPNITCGPGRHKIYGQIPGGYGWRCDLCPINHYKSTVGEDNGCIPCVGKFSIDDGHRTKCIDPFTDTYPDILNIRPFRSLLGLSLIGLSLTIITISIFTWKRKTPIVLTADFEFSIIHLVVILTTFVISCAFQLLAPSETNCLVRVSVISIAYLLNISIVFVKSHKVLQAFLSKVLVTEKEAKKTVQMQILFVVTCLVSANALLAISNRIKKPFSSYLDETNMYRVHFCDTVFHANLITGFIMFLQLGCFVQAFRGRHLPSVMNDGMCLIYAALCSTVMLTVMYILSLFQEPVLQEVYQYVTIVFNTIAIWLIMYGQKALRIVLYPKQNTKLHFQEQRLSELRQRVDEMTRDCQK